MAAPAAVQYGPHLRVSAERAAVYVRLKYPAWDQRNRERDYRRCFGYRGRWWGLVQELRLVRTQGWDVGLEAYKAALRRLAGAGKWRQAQAVRDDMRRLGVDADRAALLLLTNAHARARGRAAAAGAMRAWLELADLGEVDASACEALLRALCQQQLWPLAMQLLDSMEGSGVETGAAHYAALLRTAPSWEQAAALARRMRQRGIETECPAVLRQLLRPAAWAGQVGAVREIADRVAALSGDGGGRTPRTRALLLKAYVRAGDHHGAERVWAAAAARGDRDDALLREYCRLCSTRLLRRPALPQQEVDAVVRAARSALQQWRSRGGGRSLFAVGGMVGVLAAAGRPAAVRRELRAAAAEGLKAAGPLRRSVFVARCARNRRRATLAAAARRARE
eukprot:TRINITY_DN16187_c0_g3_i2.p2 TRINITY_DN16187_c0_g3~~TRINITY_DN16187_c0_g3_i2.p2  ORF type:complete len:420 (+),score=138.12 TRINITY_DN16187_c0_g3_i2:80-1261(+)